MAACEVLCSMSLLRQSNEVSDSSSLLQLRSVGWRTLARAQSAASSSRLQERSGSTLRLLYRRMLRALFQTNLAGFQWSGSSRLISLLVVALVTSADSRCHALRTQGPLRASNAVPGLNCFLLRPTAFPYNLLQGTGGNALRDVTGDSGLFFSGLRLEDFLFFFVAIAAGLFPRASHGHSAIRRPNVPSPGKTTDDRYVGTYAAKNASYGPVWSVHRC
jgi:hypothetical protein